MDKAMVQDLLDNFVMKNEKNFDRVSDENPILYNAVIDALDFLSVRFGKGVHNPKIEKEDKKLPFEVGDYFINDFDPPIVFKIIHFKDNYIGFVEAEKGDSSFGFSTEIGQAVNNFESGKWVKVEPKSIDEEIKITEAVQEQPISKSVKTPKKTSTSKEIKELKEAIEGLETAFDYLEDDEKTQLEELRQKLSQLEQKKS
jgi:hypothetical protein